MSESNKPNTQQVGRCGELLVQYRLLRSGIDSAPMTTDYGIDLLAYDRKTDKTVSIQVKTSTHRTDETDPTSKSKWVVWDKGEQDIAQFIAAVDWNREKVWLFKIGEFEKYATGSEGRWLWWYVPDHKPERTTITRSEEDFASFNMDTVIATLFN